MRKIVYLNGDEAFILEPFELPKGKKIGEVVGTTYYTHRNPSEHFYVLGGGYPISNSVLKKLREVSVDRVVIIEHAKSGERMFDTTLEKYLSAVMIQHEPYDQQRCVPLSEMRLIGKL